MFERLFEDYPGFDYECPVCGGDEIQEIDCHQGDQDEYLTDTDEGDRVLVRRYICWQCDASFKTRALPQRQEQFVSMISIQSRPMYIVTGTEIGLGADGEPVLADCTVVREAKQQI